MDYLVEMHPRNVPVQIVVFLLVWISQLGAALPLNVASAW
jgi:hypothetical protein